MHSDELTGAVEHRLELPGTGGRRAVRVTLTGVGRRFDRQEFGSRVDEGERTDRPETAWHARRWTGETTNTYTWAAHRGGR
jgi:hypothetical protein